MTDFRMGSRMCDHCRRNLPSADICGCDGEKAARMSAIHKVFDEAIASSPMSRPDCAHSNTDIGFGLAGGGYGAYEFCSDCGHIIEKWQETDEAAAQPKEINP